MKSRNACHVFLILAGIAACLSCGKKQQEQEWDVTATEVPRAVLDAFEQMYPGAEVKGYAKEIEGGETLYEISCEFEGRTSDAVFKPDESVNVIEEVIPAEQLPEAVRRKIASEFPEYTVTIAEKMNTAEGMFYEVKISSNAEKKHYEVVLSQAGEIIEREEIQKIED